MSVGDMPAMATSTYGTASNAYLPPQLWEPGKFANQFDQPAPMVLARAMAINSPKQLPQQQEQPMPSRRLVQVFIADPDENVPLDQSLIYSGSQKLTDATDQDLFFEIDIKSILETHNAKRVLLINKKVKERTENLEPVKIRDLKMVVVNVATF